MQGTVVGRYELGDPLGVGTVGTVFRARHLDTGDEVALKLLHPSVSHDETVARRFRRETEILERLRHPNIVEYIEDGEYGDQLFYTMELVEGATLKEVLVRRGRLGWQDAVECGWQICSALQYAHNQGIVHRDLKPGNLFLGEDGKLKLGDFGIALDTGAADITATGLTVGSYQYMSPEQIRGERTVSGQTDLYALGCLLFEMVTGEPPYRGVNFAQIFDQHLKKPPPHAVQLAPECPPELDEILCRLMQKDPQERPFNAREVQGLLAELLLKWDEERDAEPTRVLNGSSGAHPQRIPRIRGREPVLAHLLLEQRAEKTPSWRVLLVITLVTTLLIWVLAVATRKP